MNTIVEAEKRIPVAAEYDVAVAGGGVAGIAAALAAAREKKKVLLIEREYAVGGLATLGLITIYLPLCDGTGRQVSFGIAEELLRRSIRNGFEDEDPQSWLETGKPRGNERYRVQFNAQACAIEWEQALREAGVDFLYGTMVCGAAVTDGRVEALIVENQNGRTAIRAKAVVDATGDAALFERCGAHTAVYGKGNPLAAWYYENVDGENRVRMLGASDVAPDTPVGDVPPTLPGARISGLDAWEISEMTLRAHQQSYAHFLKGGPLSMRHSLTHIATIPQLRMTRRVAGAYELGDGEAHTPFADSVGMIGDWRRRGPLYEVPYRVLYSPELKNVLAAGRCISVSDGMWDISRVIPACAVTGQAAGVAAAMGGDVRALDVPALQNRLRQNHVRLHESEL